MDIVESTDSSRISGMRRLVGIGFGVNELSDADIVDDVFLGESNRYIKRLVPTWADILAAAGDNAESLKVAVCKKTAAEILKAKSRPTDLDSLSVGDRRIWLETQATIQAYEEDVADIIADITPNLDSPKPYFEVINLQEDN